MKLGIASEQAKEFVEGESESATKGLLSDYSITPGTSLPMRTPRTPATQDTILQVYFTIIESFEFLPCKIF